MSGRIRFSEKGTENFQLSEANVILVKLFPCKFMDELCYSMRGSHISHISRK